MKQLYRPVNVLTNPQGHPSGLNGPQKPVAVRRILDFWRYRGRWWQNEPPRDYYLLELETGHVVEVYREDTEPSSPNLVSEGWVLSRIAD